MLDYSRGAAVLLAAVVTHGLTLPRPAAACGGFFCSQQQPVVQLGERIIFISHGDGRTTAVVQIQYSGPSERFSWVVPVPGVPSLGVSSNILFTRLQRATDPQWTLADTVEGSCLSVPNLSADAAVAFGGDAGGGGVTVVDSGAVGPYDYEVIEVDRMLADPAEVAVRWLGANGYDVGSTAPELLRGYLAGGMNLVAFRLQKDRDTGDIRPVTMTYRSELPMIPIKLTAVATAPDLGVATWIAGPARAVPSNYRTVEVDEARIDWLNRGNNYLALVGAAVDEAGGQAMVTEYARPMNGDQLGLWTPSDDATWTSLRDRDYSGLEAALVSDVMRSFNGWDGVSAVLSRLVVPYLGGTTLAELQQCPSCVLPGAGNGTIAGFDAAGFLRAVEVEIVGPLRDVAASVTGRAYLTRMYTSLSAAEMTLDPTFAWNTTLPTVSNLHQRARTVHCTADVARPDAPWTIELLEGVSLAGRGGAWPRELASLPAAARVLQLSDTGAGAVLVDNTAVIRAGVLALAQRSPPATDGGPRLPVLPTVRSGCQSTGESSGHLGLCLVLAALWRARRRVSR